MRLPETQNQGRGQAVALGLEWAEVDAGNGSSARLPASLPAYVSEGDCGSAALPCRSRAREDRGHFASPASGPNRKTVWQCPQDSPENLGSLLREPHLLDLVRFQVRPARNLTPHLRIGLPC